MREGYVYIMTNKPFGTLYIGVTSNLPQRIYQHRTKAVDGFTKEHNLTKLVYYTACGSHGTCTHKRKTNESVETQLETARNYGDEP